jgi:hypothetical protein
MRLRWLPLALLAACSDPMEPVMDPCAPVFACLSKGVDLEMVSVIIASSSTDAETGLPIVHPPGMQVEVTIRNRGTDTAAAGALDVMLGDYFARESMPYSALAPGATYTGSVTLAIPASGANSYVRDDRMTVEASVWSDGDTESTNNMMLAGPIHVAVPLLDVTFTTATTAFAGQPIELKMLARNYGRHAVSPAQVVSACLYDGFRGCDPDSRTTAGSFTMPEIAPGVAREIVMTMALTPTGAWQDAAGHYSIYLCTFSTTYDMTNDYACFRFGRSILVRPSYDAVCAPPTLTLNAIALPAYNCGLRPSVPSFEAETERHRFHIAALETQSGVTYAVQRSDTSSILRIYNSLGDVLHDYDPHPERIRVATAEKIYLVMYSATPMLMISAAPAVGE